MAFLMAAVEVAAPKGMWEWFLSKAFAFIENYGWRVVVFVILLKLILSPLDFYQKYKMRKNQRITEQLKPQLEKLEKQYGADKETLQRKQMEINKKAGFSYMSACIPLIITLVLFITFYTALRSVSANMEFKQYVEMYDAYVVAYNDTGFDFNRRASGGFAVENRDDMDYDEINAWLNEVFKDKDTLTSYIIPAEIDNEFRKVPISNAADILWRYRTEYIDKGKSYRDFIEDHKDDASKKTMDENNQPITENLDNLYFTTSMSILMQAKAQEATVEAFKSARTAFLWIKSVWVADVPWYNSLPAWEGFNSTMNSIKKYHYLDPNQNPGKVYVDNPTLFDNMTQVDTYNIVTAKVREDKSLYKTNGYLIMVILVVGLSLLSQFISMRQQKKAGQVAQGGGMGMMKVMMWLMPIMLAVFALTSSSAFTLYMVVNSIMSLVINFITSLIVDVIEGKWKKQDEVIVKHGRADPNEKIVKHGRPDPHDRNNKNRR